MECWLTKTTELDPQRIILTTLTTSHHAFVKYCSAEELLVDLGQNKPEALLARGENPTTKP
jgi:hypothetical protein